MGTTNILKQINKKYQNTIIDLAFINSNKILINKEIEDLRKDIFMNQTVYDHALLASLCLLVDKTDCPFLSLEPYLYGIGNKDKRFFDSFGDLVTEIYPLCLYATDGISEKELITLLNKRSLNDNSDLSKDVIFDKFFREC